MQVLERIRDKINTNSPGFRFVVAGLEVVGYRGRNKEIKMTRISVKNNIPSGQACYRPLIDNFAITNHKMRLQFS